MKIYLENDKIKAAIDSLGAECVSMFDKIKRTELIWQGHPDSWAGKAPNLFPFIGRLKNNAYYHDGKEYKLNIHGFARKSEFAVLQQSKCSVALLLADTPDTINAYPFKFNFIVKYSLRGNRLTTEYIVKNTDNKDIYFGVGGHPGFNIKGKSKIVFEKEEQPEQFTFEQTELLINGIKPYGTLKEMILRKQLFNEDAVLLTNLKSRCLTLSSENGVNIKFIFGGVPFLAFWTHKKSGDYICIEPWCGLPDYFEPAREIKNKKGINRLSPKKEFKYKYIIETVRN